jgi:2-amino-4-hydroxy-6-hydroxymethyldihydropteridine diphosphokinase
MADTVVIALGSNLGDRRTNLRRALHEIADIVTILRVSTVHETEPVDAPAGSQPFFNMALAGITTLEPLMLMRALLAIEAKLGRVRTERNAPRTIDLDLILYGRVTMQTDELTLPHPRYQERDFVMKPMR